MGTVGIVSSSDQLSTIEATVCIFKIQRRRVMPHMEFILDNTWVARKQNNRKEMLYELVL